MVEDSEFVDNGENPYEPGYTLNGAGMDMYYSDVVVSGTTFEGNVAESRWRPCWRGAAIST